MTRLLAISRDPDRWHGAFGNADLHVLDPANELSGTHRQRGFDGILCDWTNGPDDEYLGSLRQWHAETPLIGIVKEEGYREMAIRHGIHTTLLAHAVDISTVEEAIAIGRRRLAEASLIADSRRKSLHREVEQNVDLLRDALFSKIDSGLSARLSRVEAYLAGDVVDVSHVKDEIRACQDEIRQLRQGADAAITGRTNLSRPIHFNEFFDQVAAGFLPSLTNGRLRIHTAMVPCEIEADTLVLADVLEQVFLFLDASAEGSTTVRVVATREKGVVRVRFEACAPSMSENSIQMALHGIPTSELAAAPAAEIHLLGARKALERMGGAAHLISPGAEGLTDLVLDVPRRAYANAETVNILYTEDQAQDQAIIQAVLRRSGWPVRLIAVRTLDETRRMLGSGGVDLWLVDLHLPDASPSDVFEVIEEWKRWVPVVAITGDSNTQTADRAAAVGVRGFLTKDRLTDAGLLESLLRSAVINRQVFQMLKPLRP